MIRGLDTTVKRLRRKVFEEVARLGFEANDETLCDDMEAIPYAMVNEDTALFTGTAFTEPEQLSGSVFVWLWDCHSVRRTNRFI